MTLPVWQAFNNKSNFPGAGPKISEEYATEYSTDKIDMHEGAVQPGQRVVLIDDLIATGGTLNAGVKLISECFCTSMVINHQ